MSKRPITSVAKHNTLGAFLWGHFSDQLNSPVLVHIPCRVLKPNVTVIVGFEHLEHSTHVFRELLQKICVTTLTSWLTYYLPGVSFRLQICLLSTGPQTRWNAAQLANPDRSFNLGQNQLSACHFSKFSVYFSLTSHKKKYVMWYCWKWQPSWQMVWNELEYVLNVSVAKYMNKSGLSCFSNQFPKKRHKKF